VNAFATPRVSADTTTGSASLREAQSRMYVRPPLSLESPDAISRCNRAHWFAQCRCTERAAPTLAQIDSRPFETLSPQITARSYVFIDCRQAKNRNLAFHLAIIFTIIVRVEVF